MAPSPPWTFAVHAAAAFLLLAALDWMIVTRVPAAIQQIGSSYLVMYYHVPSAISMGVLYTLLAVAGLLYLVTQHPRWDRWGRALGAVGLLANGVTLVTGSVWAKAAWNLWWDWRDPRLTSVAVCFLIYSGYCLLHAVVEDPEKRPRYAAVFGILATLNVPLVKYAIDWFGPVSHPQEITTPHEAVTTTRYFGYLAFLTFYLLLVRWKHDRDLVRERAESALARVRRLEEARTA